MSYIAGAHTHSLFDLENVPRYAHLYKHTVKLIITRAPAVLHLLQQPVNSSSGANSCHLTTAPSMQLLGDLT